MTVCWLVVNTLLGVGMQVVAEAVALGSTLHLPRDRLFDTPAKTAVVAPAQIGKLASAERRHYAPQFPGHAGEAGFIQRCQVHKKRNVMDHLPDEYKANVRRKMQNAYAMTDYSDAKRALDQLHRELMDLNPSAARSLETLTVHKLGVPDQLRRTLASTNVIESAFSIVETVCRNVKRWRAGDQIERWVGSGLLAAERQFRK
jgi:hypothetical protein